MLILSDGAIMKYLGAASLDRRFLTNFFLRLVALSLDNNLYHLQSIIHY